MIVSPLDVLKIRFQVMADLPTIYNQHHYSSIASATRSVLKDGGLGAFWKGNTAALLMVIPYGSLQFTCFHQLQQFAFLTPMQEPYKSFVVGSVAGAFATVVTYPLDMLRTRFAVQTEDKRVYKSLRQATGAIYARDGFKGFYAGLRPTMVEIIPYAALQFASYEWARNRVMKSSESNTVTPLQTLGVASFAGLTSKLLTLPLDVTRKKFQVQGQFSKADAPPVYTSVLHALGRTWRHEGVRGLFRGWVPSLMKAIPNAGITFFVYEESRSRILRTRT